MATKATIGEINLNLEVISVHQVYISYLTVATKMCFCLEPKKFIRRQVPCQIMVYVMKRKEKLGSFMSSSCNSSTFEYSKMGSWYFHLSILSKKEHANIHALRA
jgi:hypothetical protein